MGDRLRSQRRTEQGPALVQRLFRGTNALQLSKQVRQQLRERIHSTGDDIESTDTALTYGEVVPASFIAIMNSIRTPLSKLRKSNSGDYIFYDLGAGSGKACFAALVEPNCYFRKIVGIEIMGELVDVALQAKDRLFAAMEIAEGLGGTQTDKGTTTATTTTSSSEEIIDLVRKLIIDSGKGSIAKDSFANIISKALGTKVYKKRVLQAFGSYTKFLDFLLSTQAVFVDGNNCLVVADSVDTVSESTEKDNDNESNSMDSTTALAEYLASSRAIDILPPRHSIDLTFLVGDIFKTQTEEGRCSDWCSDADVCYCANLLFSDAMMLELSRKVVGMKANSVFISLRKLDDEVTAGKVLLIEESFYKMSWHYASVFVYQLV